jgi:non-specific serine/threonine protein kinase
MQLLQLLGKSDRSMAWRVHDPRSGQDLMLVLPRVQPADASAMETWQQAVRQASRLNHPHLAAVVEVGVQDGWPYVAYDPRDAATLAERATRACRAGGRRWP